MSRLPYDKFRVPGRPPEMEGALQTLARRAVAATAPRPPPPAQKPSARHAVSTVSSSSSAVPPLTSGAVHVAHELLDVLLRRLGRTLRAAAAGPAVDETHAAVHRETATVAALRALVAKAPRGAGRRLLLARANVLRSSARAAALDTLAGAPHEASRRPGAPNEATRRPGARRPGAPSEASRRAGAAAEAVRRPDASSLRPTSAAAPTAAAAAPTPRVLVISPLLVQARLARVCGVHITRGAALAVAALVESAFAQTFETAAALAAAAAPPPAPPPPPGAGNGAPTGRRRLPAQPLTGTAGAPRGAWLRSGLLLLALEAAGELRALFARRRTPAPATTTTTTTTTTAAAAATRRRPRPAPAVAAADGATRPRSRRRRRAGGGGEARPPAPAFRFRGAASP